MNKGWSKYYDNSFFAKIVTGHFDWSLIREFPALQSTDEIYPEVLKNDLTNLLSTVNWSTVEETGDIPATFYDELRASPFTRLRLPKENGGLGLSYYSIYSLLEDVFHYSVPAGYIIGVVNGIGAGSFLPAIPSGRCRNHIIEHLQKGSISAYADTEAHGAANKTPKTTARLSADGKSYTLNGKKIYVLNASTADILIVSAAEKVNGVLQNNIFLVDSMLSGVNAPHTHQLMGLKGIPLSTLELDNVRIDSDFKIKMDADYWRDTILLAPLVTLGRLFILGAGSLSIAKATHQWANKFCSLRHINNKQLIEYNEVNRLIQENASSIYAMNALVEWSLNNNYIADRWWEINATKNILTMESSRIVDISLSLMGAEGYEKSQSKSHTTFIVAMEKAYRDIRGFRIAGGVDFFVDYKAAMQWLTAFHYNNNFSIPSLSTKSHKITEPELSSTNLHHLIQAQELTAELYSIIRSLTKKFPQEEALYDHQRILILLSKIANTIMMIGLVQAKSLSGTEKVQTLAESFSQKNVLELQKNMAELRYEINT